ncbi:MAG: glycosyltransferase [Paludibacteraceae bacterium]|nr:glycosyltransferase [Paludibacteraceae bacterium]
MTERPLISVIVPIYGVEKYLEQCLDSILNQTYRHLEIILIDDGSPDRCGEICDRYASQDSRIQVIHQTNQGLSAARNAGMNIATGEYISFIDSDDYIAPHFYEKLLEGFKKHPEAKVTACQVFKNEDGEITPLNSKWNHQHSTIYSSRWCQDAILGKNNVTVWNKLYQAELLKEIRFRKGRIVEDVLFMYDFLPICISQQAMLLLLPDYLYYYRIRQGSICRCSTPILPESIRCRKEIAKSSRIEYPDFSRAVNRMANQEIIFFNGQLELNKEWKRKYTATFRPLLKQIPFSEIIRYDVSFNSKIALFIIRLYPASYPILLKIKHIIKKVASI